MIFTIVLVIIVAPALALLCYAPPGQRLQLKLKESATHFIERHRSSTSNYVCNLKS